MSDHWLSVQQMASRLSVSESTIYRQIKARALQTTRIGRKWRVLPLLPDRQTESHRARHEAAILELLEQAAFEVTAFRAPLHSVWKLAYRPGDAGPNFLWSDAGAAPRVVFTMDVERQAGWAEAAEHLQTGLPATWKAFAGVKESYAAYCQILTALEDQYRSRAQKESALQQDQVSVDNARFVRTILHEADKEGSIPAVADYQEAQTPRGTLIRFDGAGIVSAPGPHIAQAWMRRHLKWRQEFARVSKPGLIALQFAVRAQASAFIEAINTMQLRGALPGHCALCPGV